MRRLRCFGSGCSPVGGLWASYRLERWGQHLQLEELVRWRVVTTVQQEAPTSFPGVGTATASVTAEASSQKAWPGIDLSPTTARVHVPGLGHYEFEVRVRRLEMIRLRPGRVVEGTVPPPEIRAVGPLLEDLKSETQGAGPVCLEAVVGVWSRKRFARCTVRPGPTDRVPLCRCGDAPVADAKAGGSVRVSFANSC